MASNEICALFFSELEEIHHKMGAALLELEKHPEKKELLDELFRMAHSLKGAAQIACFPEVNSLCHSIEEVVSGLKKGQIALSAIVVDLLLEILDGFELLERTGNEKKLSSLFQELEKRCKEELNIFHTTREISVKHQTNEIKEPKKTFRVTAKHLDELRGLTEKTALLAKWLKPFGGHLNHLKLKQYEISKEFNKLREAVASGQSKILLETILYDLHQKISKSQEEITQRSSEFDFFECRNGTLLEKLYDQVLDIRMRPLAEGIHRLPRFVRELSRRLGKKVELHVFGEETLLDREILSGLESSLNHLLRNAIDHGIETPEERKFLGKPAYGKIELRAQHRAGFVDITLEDDGKGVELKTLAKITQPGFTTKTTVSEISGRGVGLDAAQQTIKNLGGRLQLNSTPGKGFKALITLPLTLSRLRALIIEVRQEPYALSLSSIEQVLVLQREETLTRDHRLYFSYQNQTIPLLDLGVLLNAEHKKEIEPPYSVLLVLKDDKPLGLIVDAFFGEKELAIQEIAHIGKIPGILGGAFLENGAPLLVLDIQELLRGYP